ncbi:Hypothetical predicted protein [Mytilus galloprovincialis]|uniref:Uncharacterized protein n=1 Tax=Mytilus galloprovincialis TaxID=29158 RepID=A0A8B6FT08_MYTGA|nr:Hypothetical predicted protein [Mytilus galloprovincialis]
MKPNRTQELDWSSKIMDNFKTPCNRYSQTPNLDYDFLDELFKDLQDVPSCQITNDHTEQMTPSLYDELFQPSSIKKQPATPQLDINLLDEFVLQELDFISTELSFYNNNRRGQKVKKRLFCCSPDDEPTPKKLCTVNLSDSYSEGDSEFTWSSIDRS